MLAKKLLTFGFHLAMMQSNKNAMTQSSKQGDPLREVPVGARHSAIKLPNWLYSGCVELEVDADGSSRYSSRDMMVSR